MSDNRHYSERLQEERELKEKQSKCKHLNTRIGGDEWFAPQIICKDCDKRIS